MGNITDTIRSTFRDFTINGIASSGKHKPDKSDIRDLGPVIEAEIATAAIAGGDMVAAAAVIAPLADVAGDALTALDTAIAGMNDAVTSQIEAAVLAATSSAENAADASALSSATAEATSGPTYGSVAAGLADTTNGHTFAVNVGDGLVSIYLNSAGSAVLQRKLATTDYLASTAGAGAVGFIQSGTNALARTVQNKSREARSTSDKTGNFNSQIGAWLTDLPNGGLVRAASGTLAMSAGVTLGISGFELLGDGKTGSVIDPQFAGTVFDVDAGSGLTPYYNKISGFGFYSANSSSKTIVHWRNAANCEVSRLTMSEGAIQGANSIGLLVEGREMCWAHDNIWAITKPMRIVKNADALNITTDYLICEREHYIAQVATEACVESTGAYLSNTTWRDCALVKGAEGFKLVNVTTAANSYCLTIMGSRREQSETSTAFSYHFNFSGSSATLQNLFFAQNYVDRTQKGFYGRGIKRALLATSSFHQNGSGGTPTQAIDHTIPTGGSLTLLESAGAVGGVKTITNGHSILRVPSTITNDPIGSFEHWAYFVTPTDPGAGGLINYDGVPSVFIGAVEVASFEMTVPTGSRSIRLPILPANTVGTDPVGAEVFVRSKTGRLHAFFPADGSNPTTIAATGTFSSAATANHIYCDGYANGLISYNLAASEVIRVEVRK